MAREAIISKLQATVPRASAAGHDGRRAETWKGNATDRLKVQAGL